MGRVNITIGTLTFDPANYDARTTCSTSIRAIHSQGRGGDARGPRAALRTPDKPGDWPDGYGRTGGARARWTPFDHGPRDDRDGR
jgi:hypothetical protein